MPPTLSVILDGANHSEVLKIPYEDNQIVSLGCDEHLIVKVVNNSLRKDWTLLPSTLAFEVLVKYYRPHPVAIRAYQQFQVCQVNILKSFSKNQSRSRVHLQ